MRKEIETMVMTPDCKVTYEKRVQLTNDNNEVKERLTAHKTAHVRALFPPSLDYTILPEGCRLIRQSGDVTVCVIEQRPRVQLVQLSPTDEMLDRFGEYTHEPYKSMDPDTYESLRNRTHFSIALPYVLLFMRFKDNEFEKVALVYRTAPLKSIHDKVLTPNLPNIHEEAHGLVCLNDRENLIAGDSLETLVRNVERLIWDSEFNAHEPELFENAADRFLEVSSPWEWERHSKRDPRFVLALDWTPMPYTVNQLANIMLSDFSEYDDYEINTQSVRGSLKENLFGEMVKRIQGADEFEHETEVADYEGIEVSPALSFDCEGYTLRVGQKLTARAEAPSPCIHKKKYTIEWFSERIGENRYIKLEEIDEPILLVKNNKLIGMTPTPYLVPEVKCGDVIVSTGSIYRVNREVVGFERYNVIQGVYVSDNVVLVRFVGGSSHWNPIGTIDELYEGGDLLPPEPDRFNTLELADGTRIAAGDVFLKALPHGGVREGIILDFEGIKYSTNTHTATIRYTSGFNDIDLLRLEGINDPLHDSVVFPHLHTRESISLGNGLILRKGTVLINQISYNPVTVEALCCGSRNNSPIYAQFEGLDQRWFNLGNRNGLTNYQLPPTITGNETECVIGSMRLVKGMTLFCKATKKCSPIDRFSYSNGDAFAHLDTGLVTLTKNGRMRNFDYSVVETSYDINGRRVKAGDMIVVRSVFESTAHYTFIAGDTFVVAYFEKSGNILRCVTTRGISFPVINGKMNAFALRTRGGEVPLGDYYDRYAHHPDMRDEDEIVYEDDNGMEYMGSIEDCLPDNRFLCELYYPFVAATPCETCTAKHRICGHVITTQQQIKTVYQCESAGSQREWFSTTFTRRDRAAMYRNPLGLDAEHNVICGGDRVHVKKIIHTTGDTIESPLDTSCSFEVVDSVLHGDKLHVYLWVPSKFGPLHGINVGDHATALRWSLSPHFRDEIVFLDRLIVAKITDCVKANENQRKEATCAA